MFNKICKNCNESYSTQYSFSKYCSKKCHHIANGKLRNERRRLENKKFLNIKCNVCGSEFIAKRIGMKYCSKKCRKNGLIDSPENRIKRKRRLSETKIIFCKDCGKGIETRFHNTKYCDECRNSKKSSQNIIKKLKIEKRKFPNGRICTICGNAISKTHLNAIYCDKCRDDQDKKIKSMWQEERYIKAYPKNKECKICGKSYFATRKNPNCCSEKCNKEMIKENNKKWRKENKEHYKILDHKRRELKKRAGSVKDIAIHYKNKLKIFGNTCVYCGCSVELRLTVDHLIPLSKGGDNSYNNIVPACKSCNSRKSAKDWIAWYRKQDFYSKRRELKIIKMCS